jgi:DNA-binding MarR family transcriptional regulator
MKNQTLKAKIDSERAQQAVELRAAVSTLLRVFLVNEKQFPVAGTNERYSPHDFQTLGFVAQNQGAKPTDLCHFLGVVPTTGAAILDRLERKGLLKRVAHTQDKRARAVFLTDQGSAFFNAIMTQDLINMQAILSALGEEERTQFTATMSKIAAHLESQASSKG